jgi:hypothetical protein
MSEPRIGPSLASPATASPVSPVEVSAARSVLTELQRTLRDASGRPRTGLLRLKRGAADEALPRFEHQSSFHLNRVSRSQVQETAQALRRLFTQASLPERAQQELERYLRDNGERAQVTRIVDLLDLHLPRDPDRVAPTDEGPQGTKPAVPTDEASPDSARPT